MDEFRVQYPIKYLIINSLITILQTIYKWVPGVLTYSHH